MMERLNGQGDIIVIFPEIVFEIIGQDEIKLAFAVGMFFRQLL